MYEDEQLAAGMAWYHDLDDDRKATAFERLLEIALQQEVIRVYSTEQREWLAKEECKSTRDYAAPYFDSCGDPLA